MPHEETSPFPIRSLANLSVVLVAPRNNLNIGAVARAMSNFGASDLRVCRIFYKDFRTAASAVGPSADLLAQCREYPDIAEALHDAELVVGTTGAPERDLKQPLDRLENGAKAMHAALAASRRVALLFGSEKFGLTADDMSHCHLLLRIPTRDEHPSMNLGQAAALCLYELARMDSTPGPASTLTLPDEPLANAESMERITALLTEVLIGCEFPGLAPGQRTRAMRSMLRRWRLTERDSVMASGFLRQMLWKIRQQ